MTTIAEDVNHLIPEFVARAKSLRPFYFNVVVWGECFRNYFLDFCLPSLLSANNIPALVNRQKNKFLICTTDDDWCEMQAAPIFKLLAEYMEPVLLKIPYPEPGRSGCQHMGIGHKMATEMAFRDKAYGVMVTPDLMVSDGSIAAVQKHAVDGKQVVLTAALRFGEEPLFKRLEELDIVRMDSRLGQSGKALTITGRQMVAAGVDSFHSETMRYEWDAPYFTDFPVACWWRVPGEDGILIHSLSWGPMLLDYAAMERHDTSIFDHWTMDGDYIFRNVKSFAKLHVVQDSDEIMQVSWAPLSDRSQPLDPERMKSLPVIGNLVKGAILRDAFLSPVYDPLKRAIFPLPVRWHSRELNRKWTKLEKRAVKTLYRYAIDDELDTEFAEVGVEGEQIGDLVNGRSIRRRGYRKHVKNGLKNGLKNGVATVRTLRSLRRKIFAGFLTAIGFSLRVIRITTGQLKHMDRIIVMVRRALSGDRYAISRIKRRFGIYFDQLRGKPTSDD